jgi:hypothetical protein
MLFAFNGLLIAAGWVMAAYSYPRLPDLIPYWLNLAGQDVIKAGRSPLFFIYPAAQTVFVVALWLVARIWVKRPDKTKKPKHLDKKAHISAISDAKQKEFGHALINLKKEFVLLELIFFNLIFIHIQRSLIWLAHGLSAGVNKFYFFSLIIIILLLIPYYRLRRSLLNKTI